MICAGVKDNLIYVFDPLPKMTTSIIGNTDHDDLFNVINFWFASILKVIKIMNTKHNLAIFSTKCVKKNW